MQSSTTTPVFASAVQPNTTAQMIMDLWLPRWKSSVAWPNSVSGQNQLRESIQNIEKMLCMLKGIIGAFRDTYPSCPEFTIYYSFALFSWNQFGSCWRGGQRNDIFDQDVNCIPLLYTNTNYIVRITFEPKYKHSHSATFSLPDTCSKDIDIDWRTGGGGEPGCYSIVESPPPVLTPFVHPCTILDHLQVDPASVRLTEFICNSEKCDEYKTELQDADMRMTKITDYLDIHTSTTVLFMFTSFFLLVALLLRI